MNKMKHFRDANFPKTGDVEWGDFLICLKSSKAVVTIRIRSALGFGQENTFSSHYD